MDIELCGVWRVYNSNPHRKEKKMKPTTCYRCGARLKQAKVKIENVELKCLKCPECGEELFSAGEMLRYEVLTGKRPARKFFTAGNSVAIRIPTSIVKKEDIHPGKDLAVFEVIPKGLLIKVIHPEG